MHSTDAGMRPQERACGVCACQAVQALRCKRASSKKLPSRISSTKQQQAVRAAHLFDRVRMRAFAIEKLDRVREWAKQWNQRLSEENSNTFLEGKESYSSVYTNLLHVTEPVHKRLNELQAHVGKHAMEKSEYGEEIKKNITDNENNTLRVFELHFETRKA